MIYKISCVPPLQLSIKRLKGLGVQMAITYPPEVDHSDSPPTETLPKRRLGGWSPRPQPRIGLDLGSDDELLLLENTTEISWIVYHNYHQLGIIDAREQRVFRLDKHGSLSVRPCADGDDVEYLVLDLSLRVHRVRIYRKRVSSEIEVYEMRAA